MSYFRAVLSELLYCLPLARRVLTSLISLLFPCACLSRSLHDLHTARKQLGYAVHRLHLPLPPPTPRPSTQLQRLLFADLPLLGPFRAFPTTGRAFSDHNPNLNGLRSRRAFHSVAHPRHKPRWPQSRPNSRNCNSCALCAPLLPTAIIRPAIRSGSIPRVRTWKTGSGFCVRCADSRFRSVEQGLYKPGV